MSTTYDFSTNSPVPAGATNNKATYSANDYNYPLNPPTGTELASGDITAISTSNGTDYSYVKPRAYPCVVFRFYVGNAVLSSLTGTAKGRGVRQNSYSYRLYIWNFNSSSWVLLNSHTNGSDTEISGTVSTNPSYYRDSNRYVYLAVVGQTGIDGVDDGYCYTDYVKLDVTYAIPTVTGVSPNSGSVDGGTSVTITGTNFIGLTVATFDATAGTSLSVTNSTTATIASPAHSAGTIHVTVTGPGGTSSTSSADQFTFTNPGSPTFNQKHFRVYADDAAINSATPLAAEDVNCSVMFDTNFRIRFETANTGTAAGTLGRRIQYAMDGGTSWTLLTTTSDHVRLTQSSQYPNFNRAATTQKLTAVGTFTAGEGNDYYYDTAQISLTNGYNVEDEWCMAFLVTAIGHTFQFRVVNSYGGNVPLDTYSVTPGVTTPHYFKQSDFRIYHDDASYPTPCVDAHTNFYTALTGTNYRLRFLIENTGGQWQPEITRRLEFKEDNGSWAQITNNSNNVRLATTTWYADGDATSANWLYAVTDFVAGQRKETGSETTSISLTSDHNTEDEWCIAFQPGASGHFYQFRVTNAGAALDIYSATPTIAGPAVGTFAAVARKVIAALTGTATTPSAAGVLSSTARRPSSALVGAVASAAGTFNSAARKATVALTGMATIPSAVGTFASSKRATAQLVGSCLSPVEGSFASRAPAAFCDLIGEAVAREEGVFQSSAAAASSQLVGHVAIVGRMASIIARASADLTGTASIHGLFASSAPKASSDLTGDVMAPVDGQFASKASTASCSLVGAAHVSVVGVFNSKSRNASCALIGTAIAGRGMFFFLTQ